MIHISALILALGQLTLPAEIRGEVAQFVAVNATTEGKLVRFLALDAGLNVFPSDLLVNQKTTVVLAATPGRYRLLAYTAVGDNPTAPAITTIIIGQPPGPGPGPGPGPQPDPLAEGLRSILGGLQEQGQADQLNRLIGLYKDGVTIAQNPAIRTTEGLFQALVAQRKKAGIRDGALSAVRERLAQEWAAAMGAADVALSDALRERASKLCARIASALEAAR